MSAPKNLRGVARAQKGFAGERRAIYKGKYGISELLANREGCSSPIRLAVCKLGDIWLSRRLGFLPHVGLLSTGFILIIFLIRF